MRHSLLMVLILLMGCYKPSFVGVIEEEVTIIDKTGRYPMRKKIDKTYFADNSFKTLYEGEVRTEYIYDANTGYGYIKDSFGHENVRIDLKSYKENPNTTYTFYQNVDTVLGLPCDALVIENADFIGVYIYNTSVLKISPKMFFNYRVAYKNIIFDKIIVYPLKTLLETSIEKVQSEVIKISEEPVLINIPDRFIEMEIDH